MLSEKHYFTRFFVVNLCLIVPILLASILVAGIVTSRMKVQEEQNALNQLDNVVMDFIENYSNYYDESFLLSEMEEFLADKIEESVKNTRGAIDILQMKRYFDSRINNVFVYYGTEAVYSSDGVSSKQVHFKMLLGCREESVSRGLAAMEYGKETLTFLFKSDTSGYMMYSYPTRKMENGYVSVNFVFSFDQAKEMFAFSDEKQWYQLEAADGSSLSVGCNEAGKAYVLTDKERAERVSSGLYDVFEEQIDVQDITIRLYREKLFFNMENELYQVQLINMVLIAAGTILSAITSWVLSKRHMNEITRLEGIAQGDGGYRFSQTNAYNRLQNIIVTGLNESKERALQLRTQTAYMIFQGWFDGLENINKAFQELGYKGCPERFFVGIVSTATRLTEEQIPTGLKKCLRVHIIHEYHEAVAFLYELEVGDGNQIQRKKIADYIRNELHKCGIKKVCIGMSQVYTNPLMINYAYTQANSVLEKILAGKTEDYCGCWESEVQNVHFYLPEKTLLDDFAEALAKRNFQEAKKQFNNIIHGYSSKECSDENRAYVRYEILGCMVKHFCAESTIENTILLNECLNINVKDGVYHFSRHCPYFCYGFPPGFSKDI